MEVATMKLVCVYRQAPAYASDSAGPLVMAIIKTIAELELLATWRIKICQPSAGEIFPAAPAAVGESGVIGRRHTVQMLHDVLDARSRA